jgi:hypothetical protein
VPGCCVGQSLPVGGIANVAAESLDSRQVGRRQPQRLFVPGIDDHDPSIRGQPGGQSEPQAPGGTRDDGDPAVCGMCHERNLQLQVHLKSSYFWKVAWTRRT